MELKPRIIFLLLCLFSLLGAYAQPRKVMNRPYIDTRQWHYGFHVGIHTQDIDLRNNGFIYTDGSIQEQWNAQVESYSPGFSVGVLGEARLGEYTSFRIAPTMHFGDKMVVLHDNISGGEVKQQIKSTYLAVPLDLKLSAPRYNNYRPYVMAGLCPTFDLTVKKQKELLVSRTDCMVEFGMGMDLYYPFFKLIPELKFCFGLRDVLVRDRSDLTDQTVLKYTDSLNGASNRMIVLTLYFE